MKDERERRGLLAALTCRRRRRTSAPAVRIRVTGGRRALITARCHRRPRYLLSLCFHRSTTTDFFFFFCGCLFIFTTEQHIMETAHLSGVYLLRRRRHLQAGPLPQPKVRLSEGETVCVFFLGGGEGGIVNKTSAPCLWVVQHIICISM